MIAERAAVADLHEVACRRVALAENAIHPIAQALRTGPAQNLFFAPRLVERFLRQIDIQHFAQQGQLIDLLRQTVDKCHLVLGFGARLGDHRVYACSDRHLLRITPRFGDLLLEPSVIGTRLFQRVVVDEHQLRPARRKPTAASALSCLDQHRMSLRRAWHGERPARTEEFAGMVQPSHLVGMREESGALVQHDGIVVPGIPVPDNDFQEFIGAIVALVVLAMCGVAHVKRLAVVHRCHDVPGGAAVGHQVQCLEHARDVERLVVGGGTGRTKTEPFGRHSHHGEDGDRVHFHTADAVGDGVRMIAAVAVRHRQAIVEEADMKLPGLQYAGDVPVVVGGHEVRRGLRMAPGADEVRAVLGLEEGHECHLAHRLSPRRGGSPRSLPTMLRPCCPRHAACGGYGACHTKGRCTRCVALLSTCSGVWCRPGRCTAGPKA